MSPTAPAPADAAAEEKASPERSRHIALALTALGVVYGDIGTSPLYALRACFHGDMSVVASNANVLRVLSLIFWALVLIISVKYLLLVLRANNRGEGGILALLALADPDRARARGRVALILVGIFGAALLYGDGMITPAISVLSAVEGLKVAAPQLHPLVIPLTILVLLLLFMFQNRGTSGVGSVGWLPLLVGVVVLFLMATWRRGRELLAARVHDRGARLDVLMPDLAAGRIVRIPGTAVFLTRAGTDIPSALMHHLKLNQVLHETVILLTTVTEEEPRGAGGAPLPGRAPRLRRPPPVRALWLHAVAQHPGGNPPVPKLQPD
jgi:K+ transporter